MGSNIGSKEAPKFFYSYYYADYAIVPSVDEQRSSMQAFNEATRQVARATDASLVDLEPAIPKSLDYMYDDVHYTRKGASLVAHEVVDQLDWSSIQRSVSRGSRH